MLWVNARFAYNMKDQIYMKNDVNISKRVFLYNVWEQFSFQGDSMCLIKIFSIKAYDFSCFETKKKKLE